MSEVIKFAVIVEKGEHNFSAYSPDLPGCVSTGSTIQEAKENMREAILFHLEGLKEDSQTLPSTASVETIMISIPV